MEIQFKDIMVLAVIAFMVAFPLAFFWALGVR